MSFQGSSQGSSRAAARSFPHGHGVLMMVRVCRVFPVKSVLELFANEMTQLLFFFFVAFEVWSLLSCFEEGGVGIWVLWVSFPLLPTK